MIADYVIRTREAFRATEPPRAPEFYTPGFWREQTERSIQDFVRDQSVRLFLFNVEGRPIGTANFNQIFRGPFQACILGYALDPAEQGKGLMHEALTSSIRYIFEDLHLHRVMANYIPRNTRSAAVLKRLGFEVEGLARNYLLIDGQWRDHVLTSLTNNQWEAGRRP
jgi:ribosomal-protein-alanine N-acetyltransferase